MKTALLVIDVQKLYTDIDNAYLVDDSGGVIERINRIIEHSIKKCYEIIYIKHVHAKDGSDSGRMFDFTGEQGEIEFIDGSKEVDFSSGLYVKEGATIIIKHRYDSFIGTELEQILKNNGIEKVIIVGFMTNFCCESTARSAHDRDFFVDFVWDATGTPGVENISTEDLIKTTRENLAAGFANVISTEDVVLS